MKEEAEDKEEAETERKRNWKTHRRKSDTQRRSKLAKLSNLLSCCYFPPKFSSDGEMATLRVPDVVPPPTDDCEKLRKAFKGTLFHHLSFRISRVVD